jgi:aminoglycoside phosphotransferase (APT) family kinase protein
MDSSTLLEWLRNRHPDATVALLADTLGGFSHTTLVVSVDGVPYVAKAGTITARREDIRREAAALTLATAAALPAPRPLALLEDAGTSVLLTGRLPGQAGVTLYQAPPAQRCAALARLGTIMTRIHAVAADPHDAPLAPIAVPHDALAAALAGEPDAATLLAQFAAACAMLPQRRRLVHGDAGLHNLVWHPDAAALVDWEWAGWGDPLLDLGWIAWTLQFRQVAAGEAAHFWRQYADAMPDPALLHAAALARIAHLLVRVASIPAARAEWLRRARRTISG